MLFQFPHIDSFSFWIGFATATILWLIINALRPVFQQIRQRQKERRETSRAITTSAMEEHHRQVVIRKAQGLHLAAQLFSLDEIVQPPLLLAPPPRIEPGSLIYTEDIVATTIPYLPAWPELASFYNAPTISLAQALSGDTDIVLSGQPGTGKTVALAFLALRLARRESEPNLREGMVPFLVHFADLNLPLKKTEEPLLPIIECVSATAPAMLATRMPEFVKRTFKENRALILLDGTDELAPGDLQDAIAFIKAIKKNYPQTRMVTTANPEYLDGLVSLNFIPFTLASWNEKRCNDFLEKWTELWARYVAVEAWMQSRPEPVDPLLLNCWLSKNLRFLTPLELTLKTWAAYAGDVRGPSKLDAIETHIRRLKPPNTSEMAPGLLALQTHLATEPIFNLQKAREWLRTYETIEAPLSSNSPEMPGKKVKQAAPSMSLISRLVTSGLLSNHGNNRIRFTHPVFSGYLAGRILGNYKPESILEQPSWCGKFLIMHYFAAYGEATPLVTGLLAVNDRPLARNLMIPARWLRDAPKEAPWRVKVMAKLLEILQTEGLPLGLRGQALAAVILSEDPGAMLLFRELIKSQAAELLQLAALGCGFLRDTKSVEELTALFRNPSPNIRRAVCLALAAIGTQPALEALATALLHGDEEMRRFSAEALANNTNEGFTMLQEGSLMKEDLMVRRAVAYGLGRVPEAWADELLAKMQVEDDQWIVKNAANEVVESRQRPSPYIPRHLPRPSESAWLIEFAGKQGLGISPDRIPTEILLAALRNGTEEEQLASLSYLRTMPLEGVFGALYQTLYSGNPIMREAVFQTLWEMASRGVDLPDPQQFGVG